MGQFLSFEFWFAPNYLIGWPLKIFLAVMLAAVGLGVFFKLLAKYKRSRQYWKNLFSKLSLMSLTMGFIGLFLLFLNYEQAPYLSIMFIWLIWLIGLIVWKAFILAYAYKQMPQLKEKLEEKDEFNKYLPKSKPQKKKKKRK